MGKWSLPWGLWSVFHLVKVERIGVITVRFMCVIVWWVGEPSYRVNRLVCEVYLKVVHPFLLLLGDPQLWCQLLKSPDITVYSLGFPYKLYDTLFRGTYPIYRQLWAESQSPNDSDWVQDKSVVSYFSQICLQIIPSQITLTDSAPNEKYKHPF